MTATWSPGETIVVYEVWQGKVWSARPMVVVEDRRFHLALWKPKGTRWRTATDPPGVDREPTRGERFARRMSTRDWVLGEFEWDRDTLWVLPNRAGYAAVRQPASPPGQWYVNLQERFVRGQRCIVTMDLMLDLWLQPDGAWSWKDQDEVDVLVGAGVFEPDLVADIRAEGEHVRDRHAAGRPPFDGPWDAWSPDPTWGVPVLPAGWEDPPARHVAHDERLWVELEDYEGRWFIVGNAHLGHGRIKARRQSRGWWPTFHKAEVTAASPAAWLWIDGFLAGSEPTFFETFGGEEGDIDDATHAPAAGKPPSRSTTAPGTGGSHRGSI